MFLFGRRQSASINALDGSERCTADVSIARLLWEKHRVLGNNRALGVNIAPIFPLHLIQRLYHVVCKYPSCDIEHVFITLASKWRGCPHLVRVER